MALTTSPSSSARRLRDPGGQTLAETLIALAIGAIILAGIATTYIISLRGFAAIQNYDEIHAEGRLAVSYFAKDIRAVTNITSYLNASNITVAIPAFDGSGSVTNTKTVSYTTSGGALYRYDSSTGNTDLLATNISQLTFTLYDLAGNTDSVAVSNAKGIQVDIKLRKTIGSQAQTEDFLSARYDMRNSAN